MNSIENECVWVTGGKPEGKRLKERPKHRCVNNSKVDIAVRGLDGRDWIVLAQEGAIGRLLRTQYNHQ
jgi:hypothetical protein